MARGASLLSWPLNVVARPERLVSVRAEDRPQNLALVALEGIRIAAVFFLNLVLYAVPLTLAGYGFPERMAAPAVVTDALAPIVADPDLVWTFAVGLVQNSAFLFVATLLTFGTFHVGVLLTGRSRGVLQSLRAATYSTGIYLAIMFTVVWHAATAEGLEVTEEFLLWIQAEFFYFFIDLLEAGVDVPGGRPDPVALEGMTTTGQWMLIVLLLSAVYYLYVLYVGARIGHDAGRTGAAIATLFVLVSPAVYVIGILLFTLWT